MKLQLLIFLIASLNRYVTVTTARDRIVCYYSKWSGYRTGYAKFDPSLINSKLCTHLVYAYGEITDGNDLRVSEENFSKFKDLKKSNTELKTLLSLGGSDEIVERISKIASSVEARQNFVKNSIKFLRQSGLNGLDMDISKSTFPDRENYITLLRELRQEFDTNEDEFLLTAMVPGIIDDRYHHDILELNENCDWLNVIAYNLHFDSKSTVNHHAQLYGNSNDELSINSTISWYIHSGVVREKLVLGIPTFGRSFTLMNKNETRIGALAKGPGKSGSYLKTKGVLAYFEICQLLKDTNSKWAEVETDDPYAFNDDQWVGFDNEASVRRKVKYVLEKTFGGIMFWSVDFDDFRKLCGNQKYPLIAAGRDELLNGSGFKMPGSPQSATIEEKAIKEPTPNLLNESSIPVIIFGGCAIVTCMLKFLGFMKWCKKKCCSS